jgi:ABC-2 type transport system ATP-binding protein
VKRYGGLTAVDGLDLEIRAGEVFGLLGPNGAGKSTTLNILCGLLPADGGTVELFGEPLVFGDRSLRRRVGVCPQEIVIWTKLTCLEQLEFLGEMQGMTRALARSRGRVLLEDLGLSEKRDKLGGTLSGGMQRRLNLALALIHDPELVILDEPEAGLDPQSRVLVREYIRALASSKTVLFTTHNMDEADRVCDRLAIVDHGRLLCQDSPRGLKESQGGGRRLEITLSSASDPERALKRLRGEGLAISRMDRSLVVTGTDLAARLPSLLAALQQADCPYTGFHMRENTLEDVFIALTGRSLRQ